jgi:hypothetical protein
MCLGFRVVLLLLWSHVWSCRFVSVTSWTRCHGNELPASLAVFSLLLSSHHLFQLWSLVCVCPMVTHNSELKYRRLWTHFRLIWGIAVKRRGDLHVIRINTWRLSFSSLNICVLQQKWTKHVVHSLYEESETESFLSWESWNINIWESSPVWKLSITANCLFLAHLTTSNDKVIDW